MQASPDPADLRALESLFAFWRDAGADTAFEDEPVDRTLPPPKAEAPAKPVLQSTAPIPLRGLDVEGALAAARAAAAAADSLDALAAAIAAFEGCPLRYDGARRAVFARGAPNAEVMVIGEAPDVDDDQQGEPFTGKTGKLLDRMLAAVGLTDRAFVTNTVFWSPPGNRPPSPQEQAICAPFLERAITLVRPRILLLLGGASAKSVLKRPESILALRGKWGEWRAEDGEINLPALPTFHPAFLLSQPTAKKKAWIDLLSLAARLAETAPPELQG